MADGRAVLNISVRGLRQLRRRFERGEEVAQEELRQGVLASAHAGVEILRQHAPERSGRLKRELGVGRLRGGVERPQAEIVSAAESDTGFAYTGVTRRGRRAVVSNREAIPSKSLGKIPGTGGRLRRSATALEFPDESGQIIHRRSARAWKPGVDWVEVAQPEVEQAAQRVMDEVGENIATYLNRGFRRTVSVGRRR